MAGLLGYALAGGMTGYGNSLVEDAKAKREAAMEELRNSRLMEREDRDRSFRSSEREASQGFQSEQNQLNREQTGSSLMQTGDRTVRVTGDGTVSSLKNDDGSEFDGQLTPRPTAADRLSRTQIATRIGQVNRDFPDMMNSSANALDAVASGRDRLTGEGIDDADVNRWTDTALRRAARAEGVEDVDRYVTEGRISLGIDEAAAPTVSPDPIRLERRPDPASLIDGQSYQLPSGALGTWSASDGAFAPIGRSATAEDARGQSASADPATPIPARGSSRNEPPARPSSREEQRPLVDVLRNSPAGTFLRENAVGPLSGPRSDNAAAPEEIPQYGRDDARNSQAVQSNRRDPQRDKTERDRETVTGEIRKLDRLLEAGRINRAEYERARERLEGKLTRLDQENAR